MYFNGTKCTFSALLCFLTLSLSAKDARPADDTRGFHRPLCFVENKGQVVDQKNNPRTDIQYKLATPGMTLYIGNGQMHYQFRQVKGKPSAQATMNTYRVDVQLLGANPHAGVIATDKQEYYENYYTGKYTASGLTAHSWNKVIYRDVYPNIDWVVYVNGDNVEYDFNVRPGGNINDIKLKYSGATSLKIAADGSIAAKSPMGTISEKTPFAYEQSTGKAIAANFKLKNNIVSFETAPHSGTLV